MGQSPAQERSSSTQSALPPRPDSRGRSQLPGHSGPGPQALPSRSSAWDSKNTAIYLCPHCPGTPATLTVDRAGHLTTWLPLLYWGPGACPSRFTSAVPEALAASTSAHHACQLDSTWASAAPTDPQQSQVATQTCQPSQAPITLIYPGTFYQIRLIALWPMDSLFLSFNNFGHPWTGSFLSSDRGIHLKQNSRNSSLNSDFSRRVVPASQHQRLFKWWSILNKWWFSISC